MPKPNVADLILVIDTVISEDLVADFHRLSYCDQRELIGPQLKQHKKLRSLIHHALYYHNQGWQLLPDEERRKLLSAIYLMNRLEDEYFHQFSLTDDLAAY